MTTWNHRVLRTLDEPGEQLLELVEVHYDEHGNPMGYTSACMFGETLEELERLLERLKRALQASVLNPSEFPKKH